MSGAHLSKDFFELVKTIGEAKSKQEEDRIIVCEIAGLKRQMQDFNKGDSTSSHLPSSLLLNTKKRQKEFLIRLMYVEMLGHDASFGYIKAVEMTASTNLLSKRTGYLTCSLTLSPSHEFRFMIINQLQRDFASSSYLEVCAALMAVAKLVTAEMIPAVLPMVVTCLRHDEGLVRKKSVMALQRFYQLMPEVLEDLLDTLRRTLCDKDPAVMGAALCLLHDAAADGAAEYKDLVPSFVSILKQIMEHRLPREFDYHRIPAPWIQIRLLKILALLGRADQSASEEMYEILHDVMRRADTGINVGYAIIYECVSTVTAIYPNATLLDAAAAAISRFLASSNPNLKYLGVTGLASIVSDHPRYAAAHQMAVIDCLEDSDESLKRKTLDLLYRMTNPVNVVFITEKLTTSLRETTDAFLKRELVHRITQCAERYAPSNAWYMATMTHVFELGGPVVDAQVGHNLLRLIAEGSGEDESDDLALRQDAVELYLDVLATTRPFQLPDILIGVLSWVLGEYGYLAHESNSMELVEIIERLCDLARRVDTNGTRACVLTAILKLLSACEPYPEDYAIAALSAKAVLSRFATSQCTDVSQRCREGLALLSSSQEMLVTMFPLDASCEEVMEDEAHPLQFLDGYVAAALASGTATEYNAACLLEEGSDDEGEGEGLADLTSASLNYNAYETTMEPYNVPRMEGELSPSDNAVVNGGMSMPPQNNNMLGGSDQPNGASLDMSKRRTSGVKNVWGVGGLAQPSPPPVPQPHQMQQQQMQQQQMQPPQPAVTGPWGPQSTAVGADHPALGSGQPQPPQPYLQQPPPHHPTLVAPIVEAIPVISEERQQMASALFGGIVPGGMNASGRTPRSTTRMARPNSGPSTRKSAMPAANPPPRPSSASRNTSQQPPPMAPVDLLDMSFDSPPRHSVAVDASVQQAPPASLDSQTSDLSSLSLPSPHDVYAMGMSMPPVFTLEGVPLAPYVLDTPAFGSLWQSTCVIELKSKVIPTSISTLELASSRLVSAHLHLVQAIPQTNEVIGAGMCRGTHVKPCLVHLKLRSGGGVDVTVRSTEDRFSADMLSYMTQLLR